MNLPQWANLANISFFILFIILTLIDRWEVIIKWGGSSMILKLSLICLILGIIFSGITFYFSRNRPQNKRIHIINDSKRHYLVEGKFCSHIPDPPTFEYLGRYFGFYWADSKLMTHDEIKRKFTIEKQLPSILLDCPKKE